MKICHKWGSDKVILFDSNNDYCEKCEQWFPAVAEVKCLPECQKFTGKEIKHNKDCIFYPKSMSKMYDDLKKENKTLQLEYDGQDIKIERARQLLKEITKVLKGHDK